MPLGDVTEKQNHVSSYYGADTTLIPASFSVALYTGNPYDGGTETDYAGYARVTVTNNTTNFVAGADGSASASVTFPDATGAASDDITVWVMFNGAAIDSWDFLVSPLAVDSAGSLEAIEVAPYIPDDDNVTE